MAKKAKVPAGHCPDCGEKIVGAGYPVGKKKTRKVICDDCNRKLIVSPPRYPISRRIGATKFRKAADLHEFD